LQSIVHHRRERACLQSGGLGGPTTDSATHVQPLPQLRLCLVKKLLDL
jgi:hypothetical protein